MALAIMSRSVWIVARRIASSTQKNALSKLSTTICICVASTLSAPECTEAYHHMSLIPPFPAGLLGRTSTATAAVASVVAIVAGTEAGSAAQREYERLFARVYDLGCVLLLSGCCWRACDHVEREQSARVPRLFEGLAHGGCGHASPWSLRPLGRSHSLRSMWRRRQTCSGARVDAKRMVPLQMRKLGNRNCSVGSMGSAIFFIYGGPWMVGMDIGFIGEVAAAWARTVDRRARGRRQGRWQTDSQAVIDSCSVRYRPRSAELAPLLMSASPDNDAEPIRSSSRTGCTARQIHDLGRVEKVSSLTLDNFTQPRTLRTPTGHWPSPLSLASPPSPSFPSPKPML